MLNKTKLFSLEIVNDRMISFRGDFGLSSFQLRVYIFKLASYYKLTMIFRLKPPLTEFNIDRFH